MNKTRKLFCAAILLLSVACKDAPMTEPSPYKGLEYVYQKHGKKLFVGLQDTTGTPVIPIQFDSIRPGFDDNFLIGWREQQKMLIHLDYSETNILFAVNLYLFASDVKREGQKLYYEVLPNSENSESKKIILTDMSEIHYWNCQ